MYIHYDSMAETTWITAVQNIGISAVLLLFVGFLIWKIVLPALIRYLEAVQSQQLKQLEDAQKQQAQQQAYYVKQIETLQADNRQNQQMMFEAFRQNVETNTQLKGALEGVTDQLTTLANEVSAVKNDMTKVYLILGNDKKLIEKKTGD